MFAKIIIQLFLKVFMLRLLEMLFSFFDLLFPNLELQK